MLDKAILDCDRAVGLDRANPEAFYNRGRAARKKGDLARAIADYSAAVRLTPRSSKSFAKTYNNRGDAYAEAGENDRATADFDEAIDLDPSYAKAYQIAGVIHSRRGDIDRAVADYSKALELDPSLVEGARRPGQCVSPSSATRSAPSPITRQHFALIRPNRSRVAT